MGQGQADITKEKEESGNRSDVHSQIVSMARIPIRCTIPEASILADVLTESSLEVRVQAWIKDTPSTEPEESTWQQNICDASINSVPTMYGSLNIKGNLEKDDFTVSMIDGEARAYISLDKPADVETILEVPFPPGVETHTIAFRARAEISLRDGK